VTDIARVWRPILKVTRRKRMRHFARWAGLTPTTTVLDIGGTGGVWDCVPVMPDVTLLNLTASATSLRQIVADGMRLPFADDAFDVVFSNSVIEHVPDHAAFASELRRVGRRYFVQTPNKAFPLEPHVMTPLVNYLPKKRQRQINRNFTVWGWLTRPEQSYVDWFVEDTNLLGRREMEGLFPRSSIASGRSIIAMG
jgi:SAM-dependent methyltransferase